MRTVTFSDPAIRKDLAARFACVWINKRPGETFEKHKPLPEAQCRTLPVGAGTSNVTSIFALADGTVLNAVPGHLDPGRFREEMELAFEVDRWGFEVYPELHRRRAATLDPPRKSKGTVKMLPRIGTSWSRPEAHRKLAGAGLLRLEQVTYRYFDELVPRMIECGTGGSKR